VDDQKKQKILIAALAVCILGAGGVWTVRALTSSGGGPDYSNVEGGEVKRKERKTTDTSAQRGRKARSAKKTTAARTAGRKERKKTTRTGSQRRGKSRGKAKRLKKKDLKPMG